MNDEYLEEKPGLGNSFLLTVISHQRFLRKLSNLSRACPKRAPAVGDPTFLSPIHVTHPLSHQPITMPSSPVLPRSHPPRSGPFVFASFAAAGTHQHEKNTHGSASTRPMPDALPGANPIILDAAPARLRIRPCAQVASSGFPSHRPASTSGQLCRPPFRVPLYLAHAVLGTACFHALGYW